MATSAERLVTEASLLESWPTGTGSPQGTISAPEGTIYTDTTPSASNFMQRLVWIKRTAASTANGWDLLHGQISRDITSLMTGITSGTVRLVIDGGRTGLQLSSVQTAGGAVELAPASGLFAPYAPGSTDRFSIANMQLANPSKVLQVEVTGRIVLLAAAANDLTTGTAWWPRTRALPTTLIGA